MQTTGQFWQRFDYILFGTVLILIIFGILMIRSATQDAIDPDLIRRVPDQITFAIAGVIAMFIFAAIDYRLWAGLHTWLYILMIILLLLVFFFGVEGDGGARRWLNLGIRIQPSEIGKIIVIITLSYHLSQSYIHLDRITTVIRSLVHMALPVGLVLIQPNLGTAIVYMVLWTAIIWSAGLRLRHILIFLVVFIAITPFAYTRLEDYQRSRITTFLNPQSDPDAFFNIDQSLISVGSGGIVGKGYASGTQNTGRFLRVRHTDFIFSVIAEEFGMVGCVAVLGLLSLALMRILRAASLAQDPFGSMICYGVAALIFFQTIVAIGMNLALLPVTGLTLPFISSGGTSLLFIMIGIGLVQSVIIRRRRITQ